MPRPCRCRRICAEPAYDRFSPEGFSCGETVMLTLDEYEAIRLIDLERRTHEQCAALMDISRTTVTEIYESARGKIADCLVHGKSLVISGGHYRLCGGTAMPLCKKRCANLGGTPHMQVVPEKGVGTMRIAVTYENGKIFQHFGHTEQFKFYDVADGKVTGEQVVATNGSGHGALAGFLSANKVDTLVCGGIGGGAQTALREAGIRLYGGVQGDADEAVKALLAGTLGYDPNVHCDHHDHEHGGHEHSCGDHGCGRHGCGH